MLVSKAFSIGGTARIEPFFGWNMLFIDARSGVIDATPKCDAYAQHRGGAGATRRRVRCRAARTERWNDLARNFTFPSQDIITRYRWFGGFKLKLSVLFLAVEVDLIQARHQPRQQRRCASTTERHAGELLALRWLRLLTDATPGGSRPSREGLPRAHASHTSGDARGRACARAAGG